MNKNSSIELMDLVLIFVINNVMRLILLYLVKSSITYLQQVSYTQFATDFLI